jgi:DNA polymerase III subunit gamma/tau
MSYQVIARKWRPQTFEEVTGQEAITRTLRNAIEHNRLHHAYLFSGARGVGKTTTARLLAKALNCHKSDKPTVTPCSFNDPTACASCREIAEGNSLDTIEFDAASNTGVDKIRDLILENIDIAPARDRYKIFVIDEVHMLSISSFNALLKTLEEPPPRVVFIMATTELHKVPDTILSRCQQFEFRTIALGKIIERLKLIADAEKINVTPEALREIARAGEGSMRDAQSAFDQVISFSGEKIDVFDVTNALGIAGTELLTRIVTAIAEQKSVEALKVVDELVSTGQDLRNFCRDLLTHLRDLLVAKVAGDAEGLLDSALMNAEELNKQAANFSESDLTRFFHSLSETETKLREALQPRYVLEVGLVKLIEMRRVASLEKILERIAQLETALQNGGNFSAGGLGGGNQKPPSPPAPPNASASVEQAKQISNFQVPSRPPEKIEPPTVENAPQISQVEAKDGDDVRQPLVQIFEQTNKMWLSISLEKANFVKIVGNFLKIEFAANSKQYHATWESTENIKILREVCEQLFGRKLEISVELSGQAETLKLSAADEQKNKEKDELWQMAEADPTVQMVLKTFRGKIINVWRESEKTTQHNT